MDHEKLSYFFLQTKDFCKIIIITATDILLLLLLYIHVVDMFWCFRVTD